MTNTTVDGATICLCVRPEIKGREIECFRCHRPMLERMSISSGKAMTVLMLHETLISPRDMDGVRARYQASR